MILMIAKGGSVFCEVECLEINKDSLQINFGLLLACILIKIADIFWMNMLQLSKELRKYSII